MVKLPDLYSQSRIGSAVSPQRAQTVSPQEASQGTRALQDASEKWTKLADNERKAYVQAKAMELDAELDNELFELEKKAKTSTNPEAIEQEFEARAAVAKKKYLEWLPDREMARRLEGRYEQKIGSARRGIFNRTFDLRKQRTIEGYETGVRKSFQNIGDLNFPEERIPQIIMEQNANLRLACESGAINTVDCARMEDKYIKDAVKTWSERKALRDPGAHRTFLENYLKAKKSGALDAYSKFQPADKGARAKMATMMFDSEARKDNKGRVQIYELPPGDGGGSYEVAGINDRFHPEMAAKLAGLVRRGNHAEAERQAKAYYQKITDKAGQVVADKGAGVEYVMRDIALNRGHGGALATLRLALGNDDVSPSNQRAAYAPLTADEKRKLAEASPEMLVRQLTMARKVYEDRFAGARPQFREGLQNRWSKVEREAMGLGATPAEAGPGDGQNLIPLPPEMEVGRELLGKLSDVEVQDLLDSVKTQQRSKNLEKYSDDTLALEGAIDRIRNGDKLTPENEATIKEIGARWKSLGPQYENKFNGFSNKIKESQLFRQYLNGNDTIKRDVDLDAMSPAEIREHFNTIDKQISKANLKDSAIMGAARDDAFKRAKDLLEKRDTDPFAAVKNIPAVKEMDADLKQLEEQIVKPEGGFDEARLRLLRRQRVEAYLAAQAEVNITNPRHISKDEARLNYRFIKGEGTEQQLYDLAVEHYKKALNQYGDEEIAANIVRDAWELQVKGPNKERLAQFDAGLETARRGTELTKMDVRQLARVARDESRYDPSTAGDRPTRPLPTEAEQKVLRERAGDIEVVNQFRRDYGDEVALNVLYGQKYKPLPKSDDKAVRGPEMGRPPEEDGWTPHGALRDLFSGVFSDGNERMTGEDIAKRRAMSNPYKLPQE